MSELLHKNKIKENRIRSVKIYINDASDPSNVIPEYYEEYDDEGNTRLSLFFDGSGKLVRRTSLHYNLDGKLIRKMYFDIHQKEIVREDHIYDKQGKLIEIKVNRGDEVTHNLFTYDAAGNIREKMKCDSSGGMHELSKYLFDGTGNVTGKIIYDGFGKIVARTIFNYDSKGMKTKSITYHAKGDPHLIEHFDEKGRVAEMIDYGSGIDEPHINQEEEENEEEANENTSLHNLEINEEGNILGKEMLDEDSSEGESFVTRHVFQYDDKDRCICESVYDSKGKELYKISQKFDEDGNKLQYMIQDSPNNWFKTESYYNEKGLPGEEKIYSGENDPGRIRKYEYTFY